MNKRVCCYVFEFGCVCVSLNSIYTHPARDPPPNQAKERVSEREVWALLTMLIFLVIGWSKEPT